jgi:hypothetical protein
VPAMNLTVRISFIKQLKQAGTLKKKLGWRKTELGFTDSGKGNKVSMAALSANNRN